MKDKRVIIIKNQKLQKIRNNLRDLILEAYHVQRNKIFDKWRKFLITSNGAQRSIHDLSPSELKQFRQLQELENNLKDVARRSICMCVSCGRGDRDMVYNKAYDAWYCTECYRLHQSYAKELQQRQNGKDKTKPQGHEEKAIDELYKTFL